jgi:hypothetical protein
MRRGLRKVFAIASAAFAVGWLTIACDKPQEEPTEPSAPQYHAECTVTLVENAEPPAFSAEAFGPTMDEAEAAAWAALCPQAGLGPNCSESLPEGIFRSDWVCVGITNFEGTGIALAQEPGYNCTIGLTDERAVRTAEATAELAGTDEETDDSSTTVCPQAILDACAQLGSEGDCTAGEEAEFRVTGTSSSRTLVTRTR